MSVRTSCSAVPALGDEAGPVEDGHVLLHGGETHGVGPGEGGDRQLAVHGAAEDVAPGPVAERVEDEVRPVLVRPLLPCQIYNHVVVD